MATETSSNGSDDGATDGSGEASGDVIANLSELLLTDRSLDEILTMVASLARRSVGTADGVGVSIVRNGKVKTAAYSDDFVCAVDEEQYRTGEGPCLTAMKNNDVYGVASMEDEDRWPRFAPRALDKGVHSSLSLPLPVREHAIGALNLYSRRERAFQDVDRDLAEGFARQAATVLANAEAYAALGQLAENLQEALKTRELIGEAKGILMAREGCSRDAAFDILRRASQHSNVKLRDIAHQIARSVRGERPSSPD